MNTQKFIIILLINYCIILYTNICKSTSAHSVHIYWISSSIIFDSPHKTFYHNFVYDAWNVYMCSVHLYLSLYLSVQLWMLGGCIHPPQSTAVVYQKGKIVVVVILWLDQLWINHGATVKCAGNTMRFYLLIYKNNLLIHCQVTKTASTGH